MLNPPHWPRTGTLLFVGREENREIVFDFARTLLCPDKNSLSLWEAGSHPDFKLIQPEEGRIIKIDQVRAFNEWAQGKPSIAAMKVAIFNPADALNVQAANGLLKTLEEPSVESTFILITAHPQRILPTIRSRCHIIRYSTAVVPPTDSKKGLQPELQQEVTKGFSAIEQGKIGPTELAEAWSKQEVTQLLYWVIVYLNAMIKKSVMEDKLILNRSWWAFLEHAMQAKQLLDDKSPVNVLLLLETLLIRYARLIQGHSDGK